MDKEIVDRSQVVKNTLGAEWNTLLQLSQTRVGGRSATKIDPPILASSNDVALSQDLLGRLHDEAATVHGIRIEGTLGEGGMGIVRSATQLSIGRKVAVKMLKGDAPEGTAVTHILREAWITGMLEHPNIVPIYDVRLAENGSPVIVLKRIDGAGWSDVMHDREALTSRIGTRDPLEWNLRIFVQVCNAIHFAHSRGIIHRDLKPENVMIGEFGEVYVLDWGIAVSMREEHRDRLPLARDAHQIAGTPHYMAPEMFGNQAHLISERTDVYLLGGLLFEIVTTKPPHEGDDLLQIAAKVFANDLALPSDTPAELARIIRRALAIGSQDRFESAQELRQAIEAYLSHRAGERLADEARECLSRLEDEARATAPFAQPDTVHRLFSECHFGFRAALKEWPENEAATGGLAHAFSTMIAWELSAEHPQAAVALLADAATLPIPAPLVKQVEDAMAAHVAREQHVKSLEALGRNFDPKTGAQTRGFLGALFGLMWTASPLVEQVLSKTHRPTHADAVGASVVGTAVMLAGAGWARETLSRTALNRRLVTATIGVPVAMAMLYAGLGVLDVPIDKSHPLALFLWAFATAYLAIFVERQFWLPAAAYGVGFALAAWNPQWSFYVQSATNAILSGVLLYVWWRETRAGRESDTHKAL